MLFLIIGRPRPAILNSKKTASYLATDPSRKILLASCIHQFLLSLCVFLSDFSYKQILITIVINGVIVFDLFFVSKLLCFYNHIVYIVQKENNCTY
jgi:hypothetical protein